MAQSIHQGYPRSDEGISLSACKRGKAGKAEVPGRVWGKGAGGRGEGKEASPIVPGLAPAPRAAPPTCRRRPRIVCGCEMSGPRRSWCEMSGCRNDAKNTEYNDKNRIMPRIY